MANVDDNRIYDALALPEEALNDGGVEILRAGLIKDELFVTARRVFKDPAPWGEVLADMARRIALLYSAEDTDLTEQEALAEIEQAFAADLGAPVIDDAAPAKAARPERKTKAHQAKRHASRRVKRKSTRKVSSRKPAKRKKS